MTKNNKKDWEINDFFFKSYDKDFYLLSQDPKNHEYLSNMLFENILNNEQNQSLIEHFCLFNYLNDKLKIHFLTHLEDDLFIRFVQKMNRIRNDRKINYDNQSYDCYCWGAFLNFKQEELNLFLNKSLFILLNRNDLSESDKKHLWRAVFLFHEGELNKDLINKRKLFVLIKNNLGLMKSINEEIKSMKLGQNFFIDLNTNKEDVESPYSYYVNIDRFTIPANFISFFEQEINRTLLKKGGMKKVLKMYMGVNKELNLDFNSFSNYFEYKIKSKTFDFLETLLFRIECGHIQITESEKDLIVNMLLFYDFGIFFSHQNIFIDLISHNRKLFDKFMNDCDYNNKYANYNHKEYIGSMKNSFLFYFGFHLFCLVKEKHKDWFDEYDCEKYLFNKEEFKEIILDGILEKHYQVKDIHPFLFEYFKFDMEEVKQWTFYFKKEHDKYLNFLKNLNNHKGHEFNTNESNSFFSEFEISFFFSYLATTDEENQKIYLTSKLPDYIKKNKDGFLNLYEYVINCLSNNVSVFFTDYHKKHIEKEMLFLLNKILENKKISDEEDSSIQFIFKNDFLAYHFKDFLIKHRDKLIEVFVSNRFNDSYYFINGELGTDFLTDFFNKRKDWLLPQNQKEYKDFFVKMASNFKKDFNKYLKNDCLGLYEVEQAICWDILVGNMKLIEPPKKFYKKLMTEYLIKEELNIPINPLIKK